MSKNISPKHTPTPWMEHDGAWIFPVSHSDRKIGGSTDKKEDRNNYAAVICTVGKNPNRFSKGEPEANAAFIVKACNSHEQLVVALKESLTMILEECADAEHTNQVYVIRAALAAAGEQP